MLLPHLRSDAVLRETFFRKLKLYFYAAAGLGQRFWDELRDLAHRRVRRRTADRHRLRRNRDRALRVDDRWRGRRSGMIGLPCPGMELKLAPAGTKKEARVRGPNITPGYWGDEAMTRAAFDEEGFYRLGDAMDFVDPADPRQGTDVQRTPGRGLQAVNRHLGQRRPAAIEDPDAGRRSTRRTSSSRGTTESLPRRMVFPNIARCRELAGSASPDAPASEILRHPAVVSRFQSDLRRSRASGHRQLDVRFARGAARRAARHSMRARSPTKARSTRRRCCAIAQRSSMTSTRLPRLRT